MGFSTDLKKFCDNCSLQSNKLGILATYREFVDSYNYYNRDVLLLKNSSHMQQVSV